MRSEDGVVYIGTIDGELYALEEGEVQKQNELHERHRNPDVCDDARRLSKREDAVGDLTLYIALEARRLNATAHRRKRHTRRPLRRFPAFATGCRRTDYPEHPHPAMH